MISMSKKLIKREEGLVAITTTLVIMIIMTLIITSFALVVGREQRQSLDRQLSTQAFYAAESGVQDAINALRAGAISNNIDKCTELGSFEDVLGSAGIEYDNNVSSSSEIDNVSYSCVLINRTPGELKYDVLEPGKGTYLIAVKSTDGNPINNIRFSWQNTVEAGNVDEFEANGGAMTFPQSETLKTGMPRVTIIPGAFTNDTVKTATRTLFMYPRAGSGGDPADYNLADPANSGDIVSGNCNTAKPSDAPFNCNVDVIPVGVSNVYFLAIKPLYRPITLQIDPFVGETNRTIEGAQAIVDVTGKAEDVLRRIQVRVPYTSPIVPSTLGSLLPMSGIETTNSICKQFEVNSARYRNLCTVGTLIEPTNQTLDNPTGPSGGPGPTPGGDTFGEGNAAIGDGSCFPPGRPRSECQESSGADVPPFNFSFSIPNASQNDPSTVAGCEWNWGDGSPNTVLPPRQCEFGDWVGPHAYEDTSSQILATNGGQGCRIYTVTLRMRFNNGFADKVDTQPLYAPRGQANDVPDGICYRKYRTYRP